MMVSLQTFAVIRDGEQQSIVLDAESEITSAGLGVVDNVRECFKGNAICGDFDGRRAIDAGTFVATNGRLHDEVLARLRG